MKTHITESLAKGLVKQLQFNDDKQRRDYTHNQDGSKGRLKFLKDFKKYCDGSYPKESCFQSLISGKGKNACYVGLYLTWNDEYDAFFIELILAKARDFSIDGQPIQLVITKHAMERLFLRMATTNFIEIKPVIATVINRAVEETLTTKKLKQETDYYLKIPNTGICHFCYDPEFGDLVWKTFLHESQLTDHQIKIYEYELKPELSIGAINND